MVLGDKALTTAPRRGAYALRDASRYARLHFSAMAITARDRLLFGPHCHCGCDCGCSLLNQPFVLTFWNNSEATRFCVLPSGTKTIRIKLPRAGAHAARLCKRLTGHRTAEKYAYDSQWSCAHQQFAISLRHVADYGARVMNSRCRMSCLRRGPQSSISLNDEGSVLWRQNTPLMTVQGHIR